MRNVAFLLDDDSRISSFEMQAVSQESIPRCLHASHLEARSPSRVNAKVERARAGRIPVSFFLEIYEMLGILPRCLSKTLGITGKNRPSNRFSELEV